MKRTRSDSPDGRNRKHWAASIPEDMRTAFAEDSWAVEAAGVAEADFVENLTKRGRVIEKRTFDR